MSVVQGARAAGAAKRIAVYLWLLGLAVALPAGLLTHQVVRGFFGKRLVAEDMAARLQPLYAADLFLSKQDVLTAYAPLVLGLLVLWALLSPVRHGLALEGTHRGPRAAWRGAGAHYPRLFWLAPLTWIFSGVVLGACGAGLGWLAGKGLESWISEREVLAARLVLLFGFGLVAAWVRGTVERMRATVVRDGSGPLSAFGAGLAGGARAPLRTLAGPLCFTGLALALTLAWSLVDTRMDRSSWGLLVLGVALQQLVALTRAWLDLALAGSFVGRAPPEEAPTP